MPLDTKSDTPGITNTEECSLHTLFPQMRKQTEDKIWMNELQGDPKRLWIKIFL